MSLSDPAHPSFVATVESPGFVNDAAASDTFLFIADDSTGVLAVSVARPSSPYVIDTFNSPGIAKGVYATSPIVYLGDNSTFHVLLLSDHDAVDDHTLTPSMFELRSVYPNPFNADAIVEFSLETRLAISIDAYDITGRKIDHLATGVYDGGIHSVNWNATKLTSGIYFVRLSSGDIAKTLKATILK
jgi:hypothetical protein